MHKEKIRQTRNKNTSFAGRKPKPAHPAFVFREKISKEDKDLRGQDT